MNHIQYNGGKRCHKVNKDALIEEIQLDLLEFFARELDRKLRVATKDTLLQICVKQRTTD